MVPASPVPRSDAFIPRDQTYHGRQDGVHWTDTLFLGSDQGGVTASGLYSLVASAKRHQLDPQAYLTDVLARLPSIQNPLQLRALLPDRWAKSHPEHIRQYRQAESEKAAQRRLNRRARRQTDEK